MAWDNAVVTSAGLKLYTEALEGGGLEIVKVLGGSSTYPVQSLMAQTKITAPEKPLDLISIEALENARKVNARIHNQGVQTSFNIKQVGVFARKSGTADDVLLAIIQDDTGIKVPTVAENSVFMVSFGFLLPFSNECNINISLTPDILVTFQDLEKIKTDYLNKLHTVAYSGKSSDLNNDAGFMSNQTGVTWRDLFGRLNAQE